MEADKMQRVLIIDDDPGICETLVDILGEKGFNTLAVPTGKDALRALATRDHGYVVALLDLVLPDIDGMQLVPRIHELSPLTQVILCTAHASINTAVDGIRAQVFDYLQKPVEMDYLISTVQRAIEHHQRLGAENRLRESEERYRILFNSGNDAVFVYSLSEYGMPGKIIDANEVAVKSLGYSENELMNMTPLDLYNSETHDEFPAIMEKLCKDNTILFETIHLARDGTSIPVEINAHLFDLRDQPIILAVARDITERKKAEQDLRRAADEWRKTFDTIPDMILVIDNQYRVQRANKAVADTLGLDFNEILGQPCYRLIHDTDAPPEYCVKDEVLEKGKGKTAEFHEPRLGKDYLLSLTPIFGGLERRFQTGFPTGSVHVLRDVTERKRMQVQILQSEKLASIGQLAAGVAHEVNNPASFVMTNLDQLNKYLSNISMLIDKIRELLHRSADESLLEHIETLEKDLDIEYIQQDISNLIGESLEGMVRIRNIVSDLKKFSRMAEDEVEFIDINDIVKSAINMAHVEIKYRGNVEKKLGDVPGFFGIQGRLGQVVLNLLINAAQALDESRTLENRIIVETEARENGVYLSIEDNGSGIKPEILPHIFDPFFTTKPAGVGTGLGLSLCQDIMHKHRGDITVESEIGKGSVFTLWIPSDTGMEPADSRGTAFRAPATVHAGAKILIVDDEKNIVSSIRRLLDPFYQITTATSAEQAMQILERRSERRFETSAPEGDPDFDLVLCDLVMPGTNGQELYNHAVRKWPRLEPKFVFFTGGAYTPGLEEFAARMADKMIYKPLQSDELLSSITARLEQLVNG